MTTVFFKINDVQEKEVKNFMRDEGYTNKAEFFRFLIKFYKFHKTPDEKRLEEMEDRLEAVLEKAMKKKKFQKLINIPLEEQLKDV